MGNLEKKKPDSIEPGFKYLFAMDYNPNAAFTWST